MSTVDSAQQWQRAEAAGQGHLAEHGRTLQGEAAQAFAEQLASVDYELVDRLAELARQPAASGPGNLEPAELFPLERSPEQAEQAEAAEARGRALLEGGRVGYLLVAGGQASRLGYDGPKGDYPIGPVSGRTLFEFHAHRLRAAQARHGARVWWYVMTSPANHERTQEIFASANYFGLDAEQVQFFSQAMLPALDTQGRILLASEGQLFMAPNGHGGVLAALRTSGCLDHMRDRGLETLSYFQVDNPLALPADPLFLGLHAEAGAEMSTKVVSKRDAGEKVGVIGRIDGRVGCIEYSDLADEQRHQTDADGKLAFRAGNIALHAVQVDFIDKLTDGGLQLPWHVAKKRMKTLGSDGQLSEVDGHKFEAFVFDALGETTASVTLEVDRAVEFSPVKNREGEDSPATSKRDLAALHASWMSGCDLPLPNPGNEGYPLVEVDPMLAEDLGEFRARQADAQREERDGGVLWS